MNNPYEILEVPQNASKKEIIKGKMAAMKRRVYTLQEIQLAEKQLLNPSTRLVADFMYPSNMKAKRPKMVKLVNEPLEFNIDNINENALDSLK